MKSNILLAYLTLIGVVNLATSKECMTPTQVAGTCIGIKRCPPLIALLRREGVKAADFLAKFLCRFKGTYPIVCCPGKPGMIMRQNLYGPLLPPQCGFSNVSHTKIIGGIPAKLNAWPWMAALGYRDTPDSPVVWRCGGTLISARHVLTSVHCADMKNFSDIRLGDLSLERDDDGAHPIQVGIEKKIIHPGYVKRQSHGGHRAKMVNDIAIIKLDRDVQFTYQIHPICLPVGNVRRLNFTNTYPFYAGWGWAYMPLDFGVNSDVLMELQAQIITNKECTERVPNIIFSNDILCTNLLYGGRGPCYGDSGGPVMLPVNGSYYEIGILSSGFGCGNSDLPVLNTRVSSHLRFIISNLQ